MTPTPRHIKIFLGQPNPCNPQVARSFEKRHHPGRGQLKRSNKFTLKFNHRPTVFILGIILIMYYVATLTSKGQITIPTEITKIMGLKPGDKVCIDEKQNRLEIYKQNVFNKKTQILL